MVRPNNTLEYSKPKSTPAISLSKIESTGNQPVRRKRSLTTLRLEVVAERARKMKRIKEAIAGSNYRVESKSIAEILVKTFNEDDLK